MTLREQAKRSIRISIIRGELKSGESYTVAYLASQLGISATPVREALFDLAAIELVEVIPNRGFRIPRLTDEDWNDLQELMLLVEAPSVVKLARILKPEDIAEMRPLVESITEAAEAGDFVAYLELDRQFHANLLNFLDNKRISKLVSQLRDQTRLYRIGQKYSPDALIIGANHHHELLDALERKDSVTVEKIMFKHISHVKSGRVDDA